MSPTFHIDNAAFKRLLHGRLTWKPVSYYKVPPRFVGNPLGWILHVQAGYGSPWAYFNGLPAGSRKFSHLWVAKDGRVEQYGALQIESWAQVGGNSSYWSVETEGMPEEHLTAEQIDSLAVIHYGLETVLCQPLDYLANAPGEPGIGTHSMGGAAWGGHACPGPIRTAQRSEILELASTLRVR